MPIPGVVPEGRLAISEVLGWDIADFDSCFAELERAGIATADWTNRLIVLPEKLQEEESSPSSIAAITTYRNALNRLPPCNLRDEVEDWIRALIERTRKPEMLRLWDESVQPGARAGGQPAPKVVRQTGGQSARPHGTGNRDQKRTDQEHGDERAVAALSRADDEIDFSDVLQNPDDPPTPAQVVEHPATSARRLLELYHEVCPNLPRVRTLTDKLRKHCKERLREHPQVEQWRPIFARAAVSRFLHGENDRGWRADFEWFVKNADNVEKLLQGKYDDRAGRKPGAGYKPRVVTSADFESATTWDAIVDDVVMQLASPSERIYFDGVTVIAESPRQLVVAAPFVKRLTGEYAERLQAAAGKVRPGLVVDVQAVPDADTLETEACRQQSR